VYNESGGFLNMPSKRAPAGAANIVNRVIAAAQKVGVDAAARLIGVSPRTVNQFLKAEKTGRASAAIRSTGQLENYKERTAYLAKKTEAVSLIGQLKEKWTSTQLAKEIGYGENYRAFSGLERRLKAGRLEGSQLDWALQALKDAREKLEDKEPRRVLPEDVTARDAKKAAAEHECWLYPELDRFKKDFPEGYQEKVFSDLDQAVRWFAAFWGTERTFVIVKRGDSFTIWDTRSLTESKRARGYKNV
jgi:hypothetical protein